MKVKVIQVIECGKCLACCGEFEVCNIDESDISKALNTHTVSSSCSLRKSDILLTIAHSNNFTAKKND